MSKFKVGDKVRITSIDYKNRTHTNNIPFMHNNIGKISAITEVKRKESEYNGNYYSLEGFWFNVGENELELVESVDNLTEMVDHPQHYNQGKYEAIEVIEDWKLNFNLGSVIKYIARCDYKNNKKEDLEKARWYIDRELQSL